MIPLSIKIHCALVLRRLRLLSVADKFHLAMNILADWPANRRFQRAHPSYSVPPFDLAFDAFGHVNWHLYRKSGIDLARFFAALIDRHLKGVDIDLLEWGCGPGRIIRPLRKFLPSPHRLTGADCNRRTIAWCQANLGGIDFATNALRPPSPFADNRFNVILGRSVLTHLSEDMNLVWITDLCRILAPGGILILTTNGDFYRRRFLTGAEADLYDSRGFVAQGAVDSGSKWFASFHSPSYMRNILLKNMAVKEFRPGPNHEWLLQDIWVAGKN